jgi:hypothetical protein
MKKKVNGTRRMSCSCWYDADVRIMNSTPKPYAINLLKDGRGLQKKACTLWEDFLDFHASLPVNTMWWCDCYGSIKPHIFQRLKTFHMFLASNFWEYGQDLEMCTYLIWNGPIINWVVVIPKKLTSSICRYHSLSLELDRVPPYSLANSRGEIQS